MSTRAQALSVLSVLAVLIAAAPTASAPQSAGAAKSPAPVAIPFELATRLIILPVSINGSAPLAFALDTGIGAPTIDLSRSKALGLPLGGNIRLLGIGGGYTSGAWVRGGTTLTMPGVDGFSQPLSLALDLARVSAALGRSIDGVLGGRFIREFVVEVDYQQRRLVLHDRASFRYEGPGESIALTLTADSQPLIRATVTPIGGAPIETTLMFDVGSSLALSLNSKFAATHGVPGAKTRTIRAIGIEGFGGLASGRFSRVAELRIGSFAIAEPIAYFSDEPEDPKNPWVDDGDIGALIANKFRIFLDYVGRRMILEPSPTFGDRFDRAESGVALRAYGDDFRTFRIIDVLEKSPATEAGLQIGDVILDVDGRPAGAFTLSTLNELFERAGTFALTIRRGDRTIQAKLSPRKVL